MGRIGPPVGIASADSISRDALREYLVRAWHADFVVAHGERIQPSALRGFVATEGDWIVGHASYRVVDALCELTSIVADPRGGGIGSQLLERVVSTAREAGCISLWLTTTNDNIDALRFYQRRGFHLSVLRPDAADEARCSLKPELPEVGSYGIPMRDEIDLVLDLRE